MARRRATDPFPYPGRGNINGCTVGSIIISYRSFETVSTVHDPRCSLARSRFHPRLFRPHYSPVIRYAALDTCPYDLPPTNRRTAGLKGQNRHVPSSSLDELRYGHYATRIARILDRSSSVSRYVSPTLSLSKYRPKIEISKIDGLGSRASILEFINWNRRRDARREKKFEKCFRIVLQSRFQEEKKKEERVKGDGTDR